MVHPRFNGGTNSALRSWLRTSVPTPFYRCNPFRARHVREVACHVHLIHPVHWDWPGAVVQLSHDGDKQLHLEFHERPHSMHLTCYIL